MTKTYNLFSQARKDLEGIWLYIAKDNPRQADRVEADFYDAFQKISDNPYLGHKRDDLTEKPVRFWGVYSYHIVYKPETSPLQIVRILSGYRDITGILYEKDI